ncbi:hypothetical protein DYB25_005175 [Aphanomyces astaci]|uniref:Fanconi-associated nuclease n=1 Tax=Aphanomyces astaci TaxID=112090 RepID=A0A397D2P8_APHAT|nr:hypothetical protein DYB25_005175 [Aphanomyces astaci]RHY12472.1 hypothetical protein DYB36_001250 [Aphanomyces astaci]RHY57615.1 hypothetical protein DYB38_000734 [Aphanomyces astaci]RHY61544.1 hypothetical protein DYB34_002705 [Aphanomyces astaci]RHY66772.1 hypothetical protein DYB30_002902 [Aphanomyces astaci]
MHMKQPTDARAICDTALSDPRVFPADRMDLLRRHRRLAKSPTTEDKEVVVEGCYPTHTIDGRPLNRAVGEKSRFIGYDDDSVTVEALVLQHYKSQGIVRNTFETRSKHVRNGRVVGWHGAHDEGAWFRSLLGLLLWDVMFLNDVPDHLETSGLPDLFMLRVVARDMGLPAHLVDRHTNCVDIPAWSAMEGGGDIDAIMGQHQTVEAQFVEVKGPRDRLSDTQIVWLDRLNAAGIASVVCYVQEPPTKKKKKTHEEDKPTTDPPTCTTDEEQYVLYRVMASSHAEEKMTFIVPSEKVGKLLRAHAVEAGPNVWLIRAFKNGNNKHKIKISTAVTALEHTEFQAKLAAVMKAKMHGLAPTKKSKRHAKATTTQS